MQNEPWLQEKYRKFIIIAIEIGFFPNIDLFRDTAMMCNVFYFSTENYYGSLQTRISFTNELNFIIYFTMFDMISNEEHSVPPPKVMFTWNGLINRLVSIFNLWYD